MALVTADWPPAVCADMWTSWRNQFHVFLPNSFCLICGSVFQACFISQDVRGASLRLLSEETRGNAETLSELLALANELTPRLEHRLTPAFIPKLTITG